MTAPADLRHAETTPAARLRQQATELMRLADELDGIAHAGEPTGAADHVAGADHRDVDPINLDNLETIPRAAEAWRMSEKTVRKWARKGNAFVRIGGRSFVDLDALSRSLISREVPNFSLPIAAPAPQTAKEENRD